MRFTTLFLVSAAVLLLGCSGGDLPQVESTQGNDMKDKPSVPNAAVTDPSDSEPTPIPTAVLAADQTPIPTAVAVSEPTPIPTAVPAEEPTPIPTAVPVSEPTPILDAIPIYSFPAESSSVNLINDLTEKAKTFGTSVAIDSNTMLVGDPNDFSEGTDSGSVSIFNFSNETWSQQSQITADDIDQGYEFGGAVDIDGNIAVVGATGGAKGAAYVFELNNGVWAQEDKLMNIASDSSALFGDSVAISGNTIVVSAPADDAPDTDSGAVFVFTKTDGTWIKSAELAPSGRVYTLGNNRFGESVAIGDNKIYVGATGDWTSNGTDSGAVYVFGLSEGTWIEESKLNASDGAQGDKFGWTLSVFDDTLVVGAPYQDSAGTDSGSAYVFARGISGEWSEEVKLVPSDGTTDNNFGWSVAAGDDLAIVGALYADAPASDSGSIYTYERTGTDWLERSKLTGSASASGDKLGTSVSVYDGSVVSGAPGYSVGSKQTGTIHVFTGQLR